MTYIESQQEIAYNTIFNVSNSTWKDWKWQVKNRVKSLKAVEKLLDLNFSEEKKAQIEKRYRNSHYQSPCITCH